MGNTSTLDQLMDEGRQALQKQDRALALASLTLATQLHPENETAWLLRSEAASDPTEVAQCLEQVLKINPDNVQAKQTLLPSRLDSLQQEVRRMTDVPQRKRHIGPLTIPNPGRKFKAFVTLVIVVGALFGMAFVGAPYLSAFLSAAFAESPNGASPAVAIAVLELPPTWTPAPTRTLAPVVLPTPTPEWKAMRVLSIRALPNTTSALIAAIPEGTIVVVTGRTEDGKYLQISYDAGKVGWAAAEYISISIPDLVAIPVINTPVKATALPKPTLRPTLRPTSAPPPMDYVIGRPVELIADCSRTWKVLGTVYDSRGSGRRVNGVFVRVYLGNQIVGTVQSGSYRNDMTGYWEWSFAPYSDVVGQIAIVGSDGSIRSQPVGFHLTSQCSGAGAANQAIIDMAGNR